jgi:methylmalonyl-CoA mutase cobalamin-binding subunit
VQRAKNHRLYIQVLGFDQEALELLVVTQLLQNADPQVTDLDVRVGVGIAVQQAVQHDGIRWTLAAHEISAPAIQQCHASGEQR